MLEQFNERITIPDETLCICLGTDRPSTLRGTKSDFEMYLTDGLQLNFGDIFLTFANYSVRDIKEAIKMVREKDNTSIADVIHFFDNINSSEVVINKQENKCRILDNDAIQKLESLNRKHSFWYGLHSLLILINDCFNNCNKEIMAGLKECIDSAFDDYTFNIKSSVLDNFLNYYGELKKSEIIIEYDKFAGVKYYFKELEDLLIYDVHELIRQNIRINKCRNCGKYFIPISRSDEKYCYYPDNDCKLCREKGYENKINTDEILKLYRTIYKTQNARKQRNRKNSSNIDDDFKKWSLFAKEQLGLCQSGKIDIETFKNNISKKDWMGDNGNSTKEK